MLGYCWLSSTSSSENEGRVESGLKLCHLNHQYAGPDVRMKAALKAD
jgi:hypothetical protein